MTSKLFWDWSIEIPKKLFSISKERQLHVICCSRSSFRQWRICWAQQMTFHKRQFHLWSCTGPLPHPCWNNSASPNVYDCFFGCKYPKKTKLDLIWCQIMQHWPQKAKTKIIISKQFFTPLFIRCFSTQNPSPQKDRNCVLNHGVHAKFQSFEKQKTL